MDPARFIVNKLLDKRLCTVQDAGMDLLATIEAAEVIGVERSTLSRWAESGRITVAHRLPGKNGAVLFDRAEVERVRDEYRKAVAS
jgi:excisionase family DNA binding protein